MTDYDGDLIVILDPESGDMVDQCTGPDARGSCPGAEPHDVVPCSGHCIVPAPGGARGRWKLHVPEGTDEYPITWLMEMHT